MGLDLEEPRLQEAGRKAGGHDASVGALLRGRASFSRAFQAGALLEPPASWGPWRGQESGSRALCKLAGCPRSPVGSDLTFPCSLYQAGPEAGAVVGGSLTALGDSPVMVGSGGLVPEAPTQNLIPGPGQRGQALGMRWPPHPPALALWSAGSHLGTKPWLWLESCSPALLWPSSQLSRVPVGRGLGPNPRLTPLSAAARAPG